MKKVLLIMAAALMTMTQCRKQETVPATPSANTIKMTITAGPGAKTDITNEGAITWTSGDKLYVSDGIKWLGSLTLNSAPGNASGTFTGTIQGIGDGTATCHFFYLGHDNGMTGATVGENTNAVISFASQDGSRGGALKYHLGHGSADVTVRGGVATGAVAMRTEIAMAHLKLTMDGEDYKGKVTMDVSNTMTVSPAGDFSGSGNGITIAAGTSGDRYVTLIPTEATSVSFSGSATGSMTFGHGIQANNLYGMAAGIEVTLARVNVTGVSLDKTELSLEEGKTETLVATVSPDNATYKDVTWSSGNTSVATVDNGVVTAVGAGSTTITVTTTDGGKTATCDVTVTAPSYLPGEFTINSSGTKVKFSTGNLYYDADDNTCHWKFEANQYDFRTYNDGTNQGGSCINGTHNASSGTPTNDWGLFGWSTSASSNNWGMHIMTSPTSGYTDGTFKDWGTAPGLPLPGEGKTWRTLSKDEWDYLLKRTVNGGTGEGKSYQKATVNGVYGMILYPDSYTAQSLSTSYSIADWTSMESDGAVFLPAPGRRSGTDVNVNLAGYGYYWSSSPYPGQSNNAYYMYFSSSSAYMNIDFRNYGHAVRLVR